jgi:hypothetical protein
MLDQLGICLVNKAMIFSTEPAQIHQIINLLADNIVTAI